MTLTPVIDRVRTAIEHRKAEIGRYPEEWQVSSDLYAQIEDEAKTIATFFGPPQPYMTICGVRIAEMTGEATK